MSELYRAIGRSMSARYLVYAANLLSLIVLARLFTPEVFGVIAAAQAVLVLLQLVAEGGLGPAIINLGSLRPSDRNGIFGLSLLVGLVAATVMALLGTVLADFYGMPPLKDVVPYVAVAILANTANVLPLALLQREQAFFRTAQAGIAAELGALAVTVVSQLKLTPLHAYALYFPVKATLNFAGNWRFSDMTEFGRPAPGVRFSAFRRLSRATGFQVAFNFVNYFSRNLDNILVGKYLGASALGIYDRSYQLMRYPLMLLTFAMTPAIQPALRAHANDKAYVSKLHLDLTFKLSMLGVVCGYGIYFLATPIVLIAFGKHWLAVIPVIKLLALIVPVQVVFSTSGSFFQALDRTSSLFWCGLFSAITNVVAICWGVYHGSLEDLCWALFVSFHINFIQCYHVLHKDVFGAGEWRFFRAMLPAALLIVLLVAFHLSGIRSLPGTPHGMVHGKGELFPASNMDISLPSLDRRHEVVRVSPCVA